jgi:hypothetical protein
MRTFMLFLFSLSLLAAPELQAQRATGEEARSVELSLSDQAGEVRYRAPTSVGGQPNTEINYALFMSEDRDLVGSAALLFGTDIDFGPFQVRLGPQAYVGLLNQENEDMFALAIGATLRFDIIRSRGIAVVGSANWSPDILTFGSADNLTDMMARGEIRLSDRLIGFAGYRWFRLDLTMRERNTLQNELFAGLNWRLQ